MDTSENVIQPYDSVQEHVIELPSILAKRAKIYAKENNTSITSVVIEALDSFLREKAKDKIGLF
jgi:hypothetical protein